MPETLGNLLEGISTRAEPQTPSGKKAPWGPLGSWAGRGMKRKMGEGLLELAALPET